MSRLLGSLCILVIAVGVQCPVNSQEQHRIFRCERAPEQETTIAVDGSSRLTEISPNHSLKHVSLLVTGRDDVSEVIASIGSARISSLELTRCTLNRESCRSISGIPGLYYLSLESCRITDNAVAAAAMDGVMTVRIWGTALEKQGLPLKPAKVSSISLLRTEVAIEGFDLQKIKRLEIESHTKECSAALRQMTQLESLRIARAKLTQDEIGAICKCKSLTTIEMTECEMSADLLFESQISSFTLYRCQLGKHRCELLKTERLQHLDFSECEYDDRFPFLIAGQSPNLRSLSVSDPMAEEFVLKQARNSKKLEVLEVSNAQLTDSFFSSVETGQLSTLSLVKCAATPRSLNMIKPSASLVELDLSHNKVDGSFKGLGGKFPKLQGLIAQDCMLSEGDLDSLASLPHLRWVDISGSQHEQKAIERLRLLLKKNGGDRALLIH
ncbi:hypothetical protein NA78x_003720 [Anatilimnocola sp. NA78]|uniref:hypothetical protein n=1 Tax=Anatilimnocola sp. NA78 TaxID=3415683 RepID=UPI003CE56653